MSSILENFRLAHEKEDFENIRSNIEKGIIFRGTNLWILVFAIFIASLGLNVNSTAVIIGAMLVSPLMGPIMGIGFSLAINDLALLKKGIYNYLFAGATGLATSTIYFLITPLNEAHSEILARTSPNIYDVLIALFGGFAGSLATSSKMKGNVIPGVAIATALMPPLCTAGYGIATWEWSYFLGAFYLFIINTVFIALATLITTRILKYPYTHLLDEKEEKRARRIIWAVTLITVLPSIYFGYAMVRQSRYEEKVKRFIAEEAVFPNDYLLSSSIDFKTKLVSLTYGGARIPDTAIAALQRRLKVHKLEDTRLKILQGFSYIEPTNKSTGTELLMANEINRLKHDLDSLRVSKHLSRQLYNELHALFPQINSLVYNESAQVTDSSENPVSLVYLQGKAIGSEDQEKIKTWLELRIAAENVKLIIE